MVILIFGLLVFSTYYNSYQFHPKQINGRFLPAHPVQHVPGGSGDFPEIEKRVSGLWLKPQKFSRSRVNQPPDLTGNR